MYIIHRVQIFYVKIGFAISSVMQKLPILIFPKAIVHLEIQRFGKTAQHPGCLQKAGDGQFVA